MMTVGILTISDKGAAGERVDESGKLIREMILPLGAKIVKYAIVPDEREEISRRLIDMADKLRCDLILTTGGTGLGPRDVTPEATKDVIDREIPGFGETMRAESLKFTPFGLLSRATAGTRNNSLIINLPGSPKAVRECLSAILPAVPHGVGLLKGEDKECGQKR
ncbi:MAG: molybdopterin adenylyltransferase [bacterium]|nr:molybdopterin adenylyltransferase [bacterium]